MRIYNLTVSLFCILLGGLVTLTSTAMVFSILVSKDSSSSGLLWVGVISLFLAPPIFVAGIRILLNKPYRHGGAFSIGMLRTMAVVNGLIGGLILLFAIPELNLSGIVGGISFLISTQGAFVLANSRAKT